MTETTIAVIGTVDTKAAEVEFLAARIGETCRAVVIDVSSLPHAQGVAGFTRDDVVRAAGLADADWSGLRRDEMMHALGNGAGRLLRQMLDEGRLQGAISVGGNQGTAIAAIAMRQLPLGFPRLIISTVASGNIRPYVEYQDIYMCFSVADFTNGVNPVSETILANGAAAIAGMAKAYRPIRPSARPTIALTAFGNTDPAVAAMRQRLTDNGFEVVSFHASGAGGSALEHFIESGLFQGVIDVTSHELVGEVLGHDIYTPLRPRLTEAVKRGIPLVFIPGCIEYFCFAGPDTVPAQFLNRQTHYHNPYNTNIKLTADEAVQVAEVTAAKLNEAVGPVAVLIPLHGFSGIGKAGQVLYNPDVDTAFVRTLKTKLRPDIPCMEIEAHINDAAFAEKAVSTLLSLL